MHIQKNVFVAATAAVCALSYAPLGSALGVPGLGFGTSLLPEVGQSLNNSNLSVIGLTTDQRLISFKTGAPGLSTRNIGVIAGLQTDTALVGIDYRVQDSKLYGVGNAGGVYTLDTTNAQATLVNRLGVALTGTNFGVDFNPAADRLRIVSDTGQNLRHNVNVGGVTIVDGAINNGAVPPAAVAGITGAAYTNNDLTTATATTLFNINTALDVVSLQAPPNAGTVANTGALGLLDANLQPADVIGDVGFDIYSVYDGEGVTVANRGFASITSGDGGTVLHSVDVTSGRATAIGAVGGGNVLKDIALPFNQRLLPL